MEQLPIMDSISSTDPYCSCARVTFADTFGFNRMQYRRAFTTGAEYRWLASLAEIVNTGAKVRKLPIAPSAAAISALKTRIDNLAPVLYYPKWCAVV